MADERTQTGSGLAEWQRQWQQLAEAMAKPWQEVADAVAQPWKDMAQALDPTSNVDMTKMSRDVLDSMIATFDAFAQQQRAVAESMEKAMQPVAEQARKAAEEFTERLRALGDAAGPQS